MKRVAAARKPRAPRTERNPPAPDFGPAARLAAILAPPAPAAPPVLTKWVWHYRTLLRLRARLAAECDEHLHAAATASEPRLGEREDRADDELECDLLFAQIRAEEGMLAEVEAALQRLRRGTYGVCEKSGEAIPPARLRTTPWARYTRAVAARLEPPRPK